jgi:hypothetical protein
LLFSVRDHLLEELQQKESATWAGKLPCAKGETSRAMTASGYVWGLQSKLIPAREIKARAAGERALQESLEGGQRIAPRFPSGV